MKSPEPEAQGHSPQGRTAQPIPRPETPYRIGVWWTWVTAHRYGMSCLLLFLVMAAHTWYGKWTGDFWEHSAVVRELSTHVIHPHHPLLKVEETHPFFSPYLVLLGVVAHQFSLRAIEILPIAGLLNLVLLLMGFSRFVGSLSRDRRDAVCFYALLLTLFLWPMDAWEWSGFVHFQVLGSVLPYPSTFALAMTLFIFVLYGQGLPSFRKGQIFAAGLLTVVVLLTHPTTGLIAVIGILAISFHHFRQQGKGPILVGVGLLTASGILALFWPYYSFMGLLWANNPEFHSVSYTLYRDAYVIWPTLVLLPFATLVFISRVKQNGLDFLGLMICGSVVIYLGGWVTGQYGVGRLISWIVIVVHILTGIWLAQNEVNRQALYRPFALIGVLVLMGFVAVNSDNYSTLNRAYLGLQGSRHSYAEFERVGGMIDQDAVVLADPEQSWMMPTFGGKVIASSHPLYWIEDHTRRREDLERFFSEDAELSERRDIIQRYTVDYIFVDRQKVLHPEVYADFGQTVYASDDYTLVALHGK